MHNGPEDSETTMSVGAHCTVPRFGPTEQLRGSAGSLSGPCCSVAGGASGQDAEVSHPARRVRAVAGLGFLAIAGALSTRELPGRVALWPAALIPTWFGISHLLAAVTGYPGCPELGAIPSVMLDRPVATGCGPWQFIDELLGP
jgi:hypothetical protein